MILIRETNEIFYFALLMSLVSFEDKSSIWLSRHLRNDSGESKFSLIHLQA